MNAFGSLQKHMLLVLLISAITSQLTVAQEESERKPIQSYIGFQPSIKVEPYDEYRNIADINVFPFIFEMAMTRNISFRLSPVLDLQLRPEFPAAISKIGVGLTVPYHFSKKNSEEGNRGFYVGPHVAGNIHQIDQLTSVTLAGEIGYAFLFNRILSIHVGATAGTAIFFNPDTGYNLLVRHTGAIFSFGFWF